MTKFLIFSILFILAQTPLSAQKAPDNTFDTPLRIPLFLSGNFGELRTSHFHAGIDMKTEGVIGKPVLVAKEGFISRIKVQSGGYGNSLYVTHPDGYTTLYAHLDRFLPEIEAYVKAHQYKKQSFEIELFPGSSQFVFEKGDLIAYSGNTGRSGGPHLHFEIRKTNGQIPQNGLLYNFPIADNIPPEFQNLYLYEMPDDKLIGNSGEKRTRVTIRKKSDTLYVVDTPVNISSDYAGFGAEIYDFLNGSGNKCGVYTLELFVNGAKKFGFTINEISFSYTRYINAHMDYELKSEEGKSVHRLFSLPHNRLPIYHKIASEGLLNLPQDSVFQVRIDAYDAYNNKSALLFSCVRKNNIQASSVLESREIVKWTEGGTFQTGRFTIEIPGGALYRSVNLDLSSAEDSGNLAHDTLYFHHPSEPMHRSATLKMEVPDELVSNESKLILTRVNGNGKVSSIGGEWSGNRVIASTRYFGNYVLMHDTIPPIIQAYSFVPGKTYAAGQKLKFKVWDELSGLDNYAASIDGEWILLEYDAKSDMMTYTIDATRLEKGNKHRIKIVASDDKNNVSEFDGEFIF